MSKQTGMLWLILGLFVGLSPRLQATIVEQIIVVIDGEPYTLTSLKSFAESKMGRKFPTGDLNQLRSEDKEVLEQFITEKLVNLEVKRLGINISKEDIDGYIEEIKKKNQISDEDLDESLRREGVSREQYRESVRAEIEKGELIHRQVRQKINVTNEDVERYYKQHSKKFLTPEKYHLRHILFSLAKDAAPQQEKEVMQRAMEIRRQIVTGGDFVELARKHSEGAGADKGGDLGWINRGSLLSEIEQTAGKLPVGEISPPVRTSLGIHLLKLEAKEGGQLAPLADVSEKIKEELYAKTMEERFQKWLKTDLRKKYRVDVKLSGVVFRPEENKEATLNTLMASSARKSRQERSGFLSYLNPLSYIFTEKPREDEQGQETDEKILSVFGIPLFRKDSVEELPDPFVLPEEKKTKSSSGLSSVLDALNPFSSSP